MLELLTDPHAWIAFATLTALELVLASTTSAQSGPAVILQMVIDLVFRWIPSYAVGMVAVGGVLIAEGFGHHVPKGYISFAMAFADGGNAQISACGGGAPPQCIYTRPPTPEHRSD